MSNIREEKIEDRYQSRKWSRDSKWREDLGIIIRALRGGGKSNRQLAMELDKQLVENMKTPDSLRRRIDRRLKQLREWELVRTDEAEVGISYWYTHMKIFENNIDFWAALKHSKQILKSLQSLPKQPSQNSIYKLEPHAEDHLKTGYPNNYKLFCKLRSTEEKIQVKKKKLFKRLRKKFGEFKEKLTKPKKNYFDTVPEARYNCLYARYRGPSLPNLWIDKKGLICYDELIIGQEIGVFDSLKGFIETERKEGEIGVFDSLKGFIEAERKEEKNITTVKQIIRLEEEKMIVDSKMATEIKLMEYTVEYMPLKGTCIECPNIRIKKSN